MNLIICFYSVITVISILMTIAVTVREPIAKAWRGKASTPEDNNVQCQQCICIGCSPIAEDSPEEESIILYNANRKSGHCNKMADDEDVQLQAEYDTEQQSASASASFEVKKSEESSEEFDYPYRTKGDKNNDHCGFSNYVLRKIVKVIGLVTWDQYDCALQRSWRSGDARMLFPQTHLEMQSFCKNYKVWNDILDAYVNRCAIQTCGIPFIGIIIAELITAGIKKHNIDACSTEHNRNKYIKMAKIMNSYVNKTWPHRKALVNLAIEEAHKRDTSNWQVGTMCCGFWNFEDAVEKIVAPEHPEVFDWFMDLQFQYTKYIAKAWCIKHQKGSSTCKEMEYPENKFQTPKELSFAVVTDLFMHTLLVQRHAISLIKKILKMDPNFENPIPTDLKEVPTLAANYAPDMIESILKEVATLALHELNINTHLQRLS